MKIDLPTLMSALKGQSKPTVVGEVEISFSDIFFSEIEVYNEGASRLSAVRLDTEEADTSGRRVPAPASEDEAQGSDSSDRVVGENTGDDLACVPPSQEDIAQPVLHLERRTPPLATPAMPQEIRVQEKGPVPILADSRAKNADRKSLPDRTTLPDRAPDLTRPLPLRDSQMKPDEPPIEERTIRPRDLLPVDTRRTGTTAVVQRSPSNKMTSVTADAVEKEPAGRSENPAPSVMRDNRPSVQPDPRLYAKVREVRYAAGEGVFVKRPASPVEEDSQASMVPSKGRKAGSQITSLPIEPAPVVSKSSQYRATGPAEDVPLRDAPVRSAMPDAQGPVLDDFPSYSRGVEARPTFGTPPSAPAIAEHDDRPASPRYPGIAMTHVMPGATLISSPPFQESRPSQSTSAEVVRLPIYEPKEEHRSMRSDRPRQMMPGRPRENAVISDTSEVSVPDRAAPLERHVAATSGPIVGTRSVSPPAVPQKKETDTGTPRSSVIETHPIATGSPPAQSAPRSTDTDKNQTPARNDMAREAEPGAIASGLRMAFAGPERSEAVPIVPRASVATATQGDRGQDADIATQLAADAETEKNVPRRPDAPEVDHSPNPSTRTGESAHQTFPSRVDQKSAPAVPQATDLNAEKAAEQAQTRPRTADHLRATAFEAAPTNPPDANPRSRAQVRDAQNRVPEASMASETIKSDRPTLPLRDDPTVAMVAEPRSEDLIRRTEERVIPSIIDQPARDRAIPANAIDQLRDAVQAKPGGPIEITLKPEELGRVRMQVVAVDQALSIAIAADRPDTMDLLRRHIDQLIQDYRQLGFDRISYSFASGGDQRGSGGQTSGRPGNLLSPESPAPLPEIPQPQSIASHGVDIRL